MKPQLTISACLIVKDEEANLARCLSSLRGVVDEIVVVDTGSTDGTVAMAERYGAEVFNYEWNDDFAAARNAALGQATGEWILWIDADEELAAGSADVLRAAVAEKFGGYNAEIVNFTADEGDSQTYIHFAVRFFRKVSPEMFSGRIHEQVTPALEAANLAWKTLEGFQILHHGYRPQLMAVKGKLNRTISILEKELAANPSDAFQWFNLANAFIVAERWADAERASTECLLHQPSGEWVLLNYQFLITALRAQAKFAEALSACADARSAGLGSFLLDFEEALTRFESGDPAGALKPAQACCKAAWPKGMTGDRSIFDSKRWILLAQICVALNQLDDAQMALSNASQHPASSLILASILEKKGSVEEAYELYRLATLDASTGKQAHVGAGRCAFYLGLPKQAADHFGQAWTLDTTDYNLWTQWVQAAEMSGDLTLIQNVYACYSAEHAPSSEILINWGRSLEASGDFERALTLYSEAITRNPEDANAHFNAGDLLYRIGHFQDAAHIYQAALKLTPLNAQGWFVLGNSLAQIGIAEGAVIGYKQALVLDPTHEGAKHNLELVTGESG